MTLQVGLTKQVLTVGVSPHLAVDMLIGRHVPQLTKWVAEKPREVIEVNPEDPPAVAQVATRAQRQRQDLKDQQDLEQQELEQVMLSSPDQDPSGDESTSTVQPNLPRPLEQPPTPEGKLMELGAPPPQALEENEGFAFAFSDEMFTREQPESRVETERPTPWWPERVSPVELREMQLSDPTLEKARRLADQGDERYTWERGLLLRQPLVPEGKKLIMVLDRNRDEILHLFHSSPVAGHFGQERTMDIIRRSMDWPGLHVDVRKLCVSCPFCQKVKPASTQYASLHSLPVISEPSSRIAMDIFGPLNRTKKGNRYILVVIDYATKWPEAYAIPNTTSETVISCLLDLTSRLGTPSEILSDNGTNFVSKTMKQYCAMTSTRQIHTSPYHPQMDGMVERFNSTLKQLLCKLMQKRLDSKEWDDYLPFILWAYRGSKHSSTGFSPYELLYGKAMKNPIDQLAKYWQGEKQGKEVAIVSDLRNLREKLSAVRELASENGRKAKSCHKLYHDRKAKNRNFEVGYQGLVFRPRKLNKLINEWKGPMTIVRKLTDVNYEVSAGQGPMSLRVYHVNGMKAWHSPVPSALWPRSAPQPWILGQR